MAAKKTKFWTIATTCLTIETVKQSTAENKLKRLNNNAKLKNEIERYLSKKLGVSVDSFNIEFDQVEK